MSRKPAAIFTFVMWVRAIALPARLDPGGVAGARTLKVGGRIDVAKRKSDFLRTEVEITPDNRELLEEFTEEEIETCVVVTSRPPVQPGADGMEQELFEDLMESIKEGGAILRGEREAARRTRIEDLAEFVSDPTEKM